MIKVSQLKVPLGEGPQTALKQALAKLRVDPQRLTDWQVARRAIDARKKPRLFFVYTLLLSLSGDEDAVVRRAKDPDVVMVAPELPLTVPTVLSTTRPVVVGFGPAGMFAALLMARAGLKPLVLERGQQLEDRAQSVSTFFRQGILNTESNIAFGEGGAGTYSDGKVNTGIKDPLCRQALHILHAHGAPESILYEARPHIGTDKLSHIVRSLREEILSLGGEILFDTRLTDIGFSSGAVSSVTAQGPQGAVTVATDTVFIALGHSARDTMTWLFDKGLAMKPKPFSVGVRIEHPQSLIDAAQYGAAAGHEALPPAEYRLAVRTAEGRGVYSFCMCPGGSVVNAASERGGVVTNGMSASARSRSNANAALLVDVRVSDFDRGHPLDGFTFQRQLEQAAFTAGGGDYHAPAQKLGDFLSGRVSSEAGALKPSLMPGVRFMDLGLLLPDFVTHSLKEALPMLDRRLKGFAWPDAVMTAVETRSSSPVTVLRDEKMQGSIPGLFPLGEGAGQAGGILSAAVDGMKAALIHINSLA